VSRSVAVEVAGVLVFLLGLYMYVIPASESPFFEVWIGNTDIAPAIVGFVGVIIWRFGSALRHHFLVQTRREDEDIFDELEKREQSGQRDEEEFLSRLREAVSFQALRRRVDRIVFTSFLAGLLLVTGAAFVGAIQSHRESGFDVTTVAFSAFTVLAILALIRHIWERRSTP
jgi:hypothetical protein